MSWRDNYQQGSLDGAKFLTKMSELTPGRKVAVYDTPFGEGTVTSIDLGKKPLRFVLDAEFIGEEYTKERDAFLKVINKAGAKELVHPFYGRLYVIPDPQAPLTLTENPNDEGGVAGVRLTMLRHRAPATATNSPGARLGTAASMKKAGLDLASAISEDISELSSFDDFVASANVAILDDMVSDLQSLNGDIDALLATPGNLASQLTSIAGELGELLSAPDKLFSALAGAFESVGSAFGQLGPDDRKHSAAQTERILANISALGSASEAETIPDIDTAPRKQQRQGKAKILLNFRALGIRSIADSLADNPPDNARDARKNARKVRQGLTSVLETSVNGAELAAPVRRAVTRYRAAAIAHLEAQAGQLVNTIQYVPPISLPAEVIAWGLYSDSRRASDVASRAEAEHPGLIPGGVAIELLAS